MPRAVIIYSPRGFLSANKGLFALGAMGGDEAPTDLSYMFKKI
jgi:hypothetical protein